MIRNAWLVDLQYRASIVLWVLWGLVEPAIALGIWWSIAGAGAVGGYGRGDFARYFFALMLVNQLTLAWDSWYLDRWIREGELNFRLARPLHPAHEALADDHRYSAHNARWKAECGSCHLAYPPQLLPAPALRSIMAGLDRHFGTDASLDPAAAAEIGTFLENKVGSGRRAGAHSLRITETAWFRREHDEVPEAAWKRPAIRSAANSTARVQREYPPERYIYYFWVTGDSFELFRQIRKSLWERQYEVGWKPTGKEQSLEVCNGFEGSTTFEPQ